MTAPVAVMAPRLLRRRLMVAAGGASLTYAAVGAIDGAWTSAALAVWALPVVLAAIEDAKTARLPDGVIRPGTVAVSIVLFAQAVVAGPGTLLGPVAAAGLFGGCFLVIHLIAPTGLGYGNVKFALLLALGVGVVALVGVVLVMILAVVAQVGITVVRPLPAQRAGLVGRREAPFGPALALASFVVVVVGLWGGQA